MTAHQATDGCNGVWETLSFPYGLPLLSRFSPAPTAEPCHEARAWTSPGRLLAIYWTTPGHHLDAKRGFPYTIAPVVHGDGR